MLLVLIVIIAAIFFIPWPKSARQQTPKFNVADLKFPKDFFWGAATAAHQVEGNQDNNLTIWEKANADRLAQESEAKFKSVVPDWDQLKPEATNPNNYISGIAVDHFNRYPEDLDLARHIGLNAYRFSVEWSRIEPVRGEYSESAIEHYREVIAAVKERGMIPFVTLWHRSQPQWVTQQGDWANSQTVEDYARFVEFTVSRLGGEVDYWMPFNEPALHVLSGYLGKMPPEQHSLIKANKAFKNMIAAHNRVYEIIHRINSNAKVASTQALQYVEPRPNTLINRVVAYLLNYLANYRFLNGTRSAHDFVAIQYYGPVAYGITTTGFNIDRTPAEGDRTDFGWDIYPHGLYELLNNMYQRYGKPIVITENGIADGMDRLRKKYILDHLYWVRQAMDQGVPVRGYIYWTLMDNFEWDTGFWPKFGLIEIDRKNNLARRVRPSAEALTEVIRQSR